MQSRAVAAIIAAMGMAISAVNASPVSHPFTLIDEVERSAGQGNASTQIIRSIRLRDSGQTVRLVHTLLPDGRLTLRAKDQSEETLEVLEDYCNREGLTLVVEADAKLSRQAVALLACGARKEGASSTGREPQFRTNPRHDLVKGNDSVVLSIESPGSIYKGEIGHFHIYADFEYEFGGGRLAEVDVDFMPGCTFSQSEYINNWGMVSQGLTCGTSSVPLGIYNGQGTARMGTIFDRSFVDTEVWRHSSRAAPAARRELRRQTL